MCWLVELHVIRAGHDHHDHATGSCVPRSRSRTSRNASARSTPWIASRFSLARGEFFGLLGPNGADKTTLMSLVAGLRAPDSGRISINGQRVGPNAMAPRHELGFVPQAIALYEELSARRQTAPS